MKTVTITYSARGNFDVRNETIEVPKNASDLEIYIRVMNALMIKSGLDLYWSKD